MRVVYVVAENYHKTDALIRLLNNHSQRDRMDLRPIVSIDKLRQVGDGEAVLVEPIFNPAWRAEVEHVLNVRNFRWGTAECDGGYVLGELL